MNALQTAKRAKIVFLPLFMVPLALSLLWYLNGHDGANAIEYFILRTGNWTIRFLLITLAVSPLRQLVKWNWLITYRRPLGLTAFFYGCAHLIAYVYLDFGMDIKFIYQDILTSPYIYVGLIAFLLLIPLAITSTRKAIRRLGKKWTILHRLVYISITLGIVHYLLQIKHLSLQIWIYIFVLLLLFGFRLFSFMRKNQSE